MTHRGSGNNNRYIQRDTQAVLQNRASLLALLWNYSGPTLHVVSLVSYLYNTPDLFWDCPRLPACMHVRCVSFFADSAMILVLLHVWPCIQIKPCRSVQICMHGYRFPCSLLLPARRLSWGSAGSQWRVYSGGLWGLEHPPVLPDNHETELI